MKKKILIAVPLVLLGIVGILWLKGMDMREIKSEIIVSAPPEKVWKIFSNLGLPLINILKLKARFSVGFDSLMGPFL